MVVSKSDGSSASYRLARSIGILTAPPLMALVATTWMYLYNAELFGDGAGWYWMALAFLTALPVSAYILKMIIPSVRAQGRRGERRLAFIMSVAGYIIGTAICLLRKAPRAVSGLFLSYLASGVLLALVNAVLKFRASGHACGFSGPLVYLARIAEPLPVLVCSVIALPLVYWARLHQGRHSLRELLWGTLVGLTATGLVMLLYM
ncbi:MAG: hypothetical protein VB144_13685 [Clostridia bacterium]|nr:hypothetical protein [Clostridia bacterium]